MRRAGLLSLALLFAIPASSSAQSITDARRVEFTPSADNDTIDPATGVALVTNYTVDVFLAGAAVVQQTANLGKPAPDADGLIRVDFVSLLSSPLAAGIAYEVAVNAVGPGGATPSARSNTFSFSSSCSPTLSSTSQSVAAAGGAVNVSVNAAAGCPWTATSGAAWITITSGASGSGAGTVALAVPANTAITSRSGTATIAGTVFTVTQAAASCTFTLSPTSQAFTATGGISTVNVTTSSTCSWTATGGTSWATIANGAAQLGSGSVGITAASNPTTQSRTATLTIAGKSFVVTQQAATCTYAVSPQSATVPPGGGTGTVAVTTTSTCGWTSSSAASWISLAGSGTGSGTVTYTVGANAGTATRSATVTIAGVAVKFAQAPLTTPTPPANLRIIK